MSSPSGVFQAFLTSIFQSGVVVAQVFCVVASVACCAAGVAGVWRWRVVSQRHLKDPAKARHLSYVSKKHRLGATIEEGNLGEPSRPSGKRRRRRSSAIRSGARAAGNNESAPASEAGSVRSGASRKASVLMLAEMTEADFAPQTNTTRGANILEFIRKTAKTRGTPADGDSDGEGIDGLGALSRRQRIRAERGEPSGDRDAFDSSTDGEEYGDDGSSSDGSRAEHAVMAEMDMSMRSALGMSTRGASALSPAMAAAVAAQALRNMRGRPSGPQRAAGHTAWGSRRGTPTLASASSVSTVQALANRGISSHSPAVFSQQAQNSKTNPRRPRMSAEGSNQGVFRGDRHNVLVAGGRSGLPGQAEAGAEAASVVTRALRSASRGGEIFFNFLQRLGRGVKEPAGEGLGTPTGESSPSPHRSGKSRAAAAADGRRDGRPVLVGGVFAGAVTNDKIQRTSPPQRPFPTPADRSPALLPSPHHGEISPQREGEDPKGKGQQQRANKEKAPRASRVSATWNSLWASVNPGGQGGAVGRPPLPSGASNRLVSVRLVPLPPCSRVATPVERASAPISINKRER